MYSSKRIPYSYTGIPYTGIPYTGIKYEKSTFWSEAIYTQQFVIALRSLA